MSETKTDKKQITLSFKTKDAREIEMYQFFSSAMGRQALMKSILWEYYQKTKATGSFMPPVITPESNTNTNITDTSSDGPIAPTITNSTVKKKRNVPGGNALSLLG